MVKTNSSEQSSKNDICKVKTGWIRRYLNLESLLERRDELQQQERKASNQILPCKLRLVSHGMCRMYEITNLNMKKKTANHLTILKITFGKLVKRKNTRRVVCKDDLGPVRFKINKNL